MKSVMLPVLYATNADRSDQQLGQLDTQGDRRLWIPVRRGQAYLGERAFICPDPC